RRARRAALSPGRRESGGVAQSRSGPQDRAGQPRRDAPVMLSYVADERGVELPEQTIAARSASFVDGLRRRLEEKPPSPSSPPRHQIGLLGVQEEGLVEPSR